MKIAKTSNFVKRYKRLPERIQKQVDKQFLFLEQDFFHPSLRTKRLTGFPDWWEFRVSRGYHMVGRKTNETIALYLVGPHDEGLGEK